MRLANFNSRFAITDLNIVVSDVISGKPIHLDRAIHVLTWRRVEFFKQTETAKRAELGNL